MSTDGFLPAMARKVCPRSNKFTETSPKASLMAALKPQPTASNLLGFTGTPGSECHVLGRGRDGGDRLSLLLDCMKRPDIAASATAYTPRYKQENKT